MCGLSTRFFFFQAEDGIRDDLVTGVQTCALPISGSPWENGVQFHEGHEVGHFVELDAILPRASRGSCDRSDRSFSVPEAESRSEERRVGKECRSRWAPYH